MYEYDYDWDWDPEFSSGGGVTYKGRGTVTCRGERTENGQAVTFAPVARSGKGWTVRLTAPRYIHSGTDGCAYAGAVRDPNRNPLYQEPESILTGPHPFTDDRWWDTGAAEFAANTRLTDRSLRKPTLAVSAGRKVDTAAAACGTPEPDWTDHWCTGTLTWTAGMRLRRQRCTGPKGAGRTLTGGANVWMLCSKRDSLPPWAS